MLFGLHYFLLIDNAKKESRSLVCGFSFRKLQTCVAIGVAGIGSNSVVGN